MATKKNDIISKYMDDNKEELAGRFAKVQAKLLAGWEKQGIDVWSNPGDISRELQKNPGEIPLCLGYPFESLRNND